MPLSFSYYMPTRIIFGAGRLDELSYCPQIPGRKALVVIGSSGAMRHNGYLERVERLLNKYGVETAVYDRILPNPVCEHVEEGGRAARDLGCDFVLGLGGGSTLDSAKSIAVMATNPGRYWDYVHGGSGGGKGLVERPLPIVAVPTTAGTGSEANPWTVITKTETREKIGWGVPETFPALSIVDPELMLSVPPVTTAHSGMDAFFHAVEAYLSTAHQPTSDHLALEAVRLISTFLPRAVADGSDMEARTMLAWASTEAGICESLSTCISHHSLEHAVSAFHPEVSHGAGLTMLAVAYFTYLAERAPERFPALAAAMGEDVAKLPEKERAGAFVAALRKLISAVGLSSERLSAHGVRAEDLKELAENSHATMGGLYETTPVTMTVEDATEILRKAYA